MVEEFRADVDRLREASQFTAVKADAIRDRLRHLDATVGKELLADGWQGTAASAYDESWVEWKAGAERVAAALEASSVSLAAAANAYELRDAANSGAIGGLSALDLP